MSVPPEAAGSGLGPLTVRNVAQAADVPPTPLRDNGEPWRFEMIYSGGGLRAYAQTPAALVEALSPGYVGLVSADAEAARVTLACRLQVRLQAELTATAEFALCTTAEQAVLLGDFSVPPHVSRWDAAVPLVLVRAFYEPVGTIQRPEGDALLWLDPSDDWELLLSLAEAGIVILAEHHDSADPAATGPVLDA